MNQENVSVWKWTCETMRCYWKSMVPIMIAAVLLAVSGTLFPIIWQTLIDDATNGVMNRWLTALFLVLFVIQASPLVFITRSRFLNRYRLDARYDMFKHVLRLSMPFLKEKNSTELLLESRKGVDAGTSLLRIFLQGDLLADIPIACFGLWYVSNHSLVAGAVLVSLIIVFVFTSYLLGKRIAVIEEEYNSLDNKVSARHQEIVQRMDIVKLHSAEQQEREWYLDQGSKALVLNNRKHSYYAAFNLMSGLSHVLPFCIALFVFLPSVASGQLSVGTLIALQLFSMRAVAPAGFLGDMYQDIQTNSAKLKPALRLLEQQPTVVESSSPVEMSPLRHEISLRDVTLTYLGQEVPAIRNVSLTITAANRVAIVGPNGSGKSTLAYILARLYDPDHGIVTMDGIDVRQFSFASLYRQVSFVTQEVSVLSGTIGDNVEYGLERNSVEQTMRACRDAAAMFVQHHSDGLRREVGEEGCKLSGGERQKLALARVFLRRPSVVILDEATAAVDRMAERDIQVAFDRLLAMNGGTTMIVIAHRMSTVRNADKIIVLETGRVVDEGTHEELLVRCQLYQELCTDMATT